MLNNSTKRALRTGFHVLISVLLAVPAMVSNLPSWEVLGQVVIVAGVVSKVINAAEEAGVIPAWLKAEVPTEVNPTPAVPVEPPKDFNEADHSYTVIDPAAFEDGDEIDSTSVDEG